MSNAPAVPPMPPVPGGTTGAGNDVIAGLAREVEALRRTCGATAGDVAVLGPRVDELARLIEQLATKVTALAARPAPVPAPSWLLAPTDPAHVTSMLDELGRWLFVVFLRYHDGAEALPECWLRHPEIVEELLWLMHAWLSAYQGPGASVTKAADWHDRQRPGVVRRILVYGRRGGGACSPERHVTRVEWDQNPAGAVAVPGLDELPELAAWWAARRDDAAPEPEPAGVPSWETAHL